MRPMCFYGSESLGIRADNLTVHCVVAAWEWPSYLDPETQEKGLKVKVSSFRRQVRNKLAAAKVNGNYVQSIVALNEAIEQGFDETLMLDMDNFVAEGSGENFFMVKDSKLITPDLDASLDGITRRTIIHLAKELNIDFEERKILLEEVFNCDEAFFTGTAVEVVPINSVDNKLISNGLRGPVTEKLQKTYLEQVRGKRAANADWLTTVKDKSLPNMKILIVGPSWVGDSVISQSLFKIIHSKSENTMIDVLAPKWTIDIFKRMDEVSEAILLPFDHGELRFKDRAELEKV